MKKKHKRVHSGWMRRTSRIYLNDLNEGKADTLRDFLNQYQQATNYTITRLWSERDISSDLLAKDVTDDIGARFDITARLSQCVGKQAKEIVASQREKSKRKQRMPRMTSHTANLDGRFVEIDEFDTNGHFDMCIKTSSGVPKMVIPFNWTKHASKFREKKKEKGMEDEPEWLISNSIRLGYDEKGIFIDIIFEKEKPSLRKTGRVLGMDRGYRCMLACSDGQMIGKELKEEIEKGGKRRKSYHHYIETEMNRHLKTLNTENVKLIALENLKKVKANKRGKFSLKVNRLLLFWQYAKAGERLEQFCEENGICIAYKSPWKTSQRCSVCGNIDRRNRKGERFFCLKCESEINADHNASRNLEFLGLVGVYSLRSLTSEGLE